MSATLSDIAKATRTSISTVSRVISGGPASDRISDKTRQLVLDSARELGYRPNLLARSLRTRRTNTIALLVSDISNPWFGKLASLIEQNLYRNGYSLMLCNSCEDANLEKEYLELLPQKGIDGLIVVPLARERHTVMDLIPENLPLVVVDRPIPGIPASVSSDTEQSAQLLCDKLAQAGIRKIGLVKGPGNIVTHRQRAEVIARRFTVVNSHEGPAQRETGQVAWQVMQTLDLDAVVCTNNFLGEGVIEGMTDHAHFLPLGCFDEIPMLHLLPLAIACTLQDVPRLADESVKELLAQLKGMHKPQPVVIPAKVVSNAMFDRLVTGAVSKKSASRY